MCVAKSSFSTFFLIHFDQTKQLYVDLNISKENDIDAIIDHVNLRYAKFKNYSPRIKVQFILFLNKFLNSVKSRCWSTKLKFADLVWILSKIRHLIEFFKHSTIVYIDHDVSYEIVIQTSLSIFFLDKLNLRLMCASKYIRRFFLIIRHKSEKLHVVFDALLRLFISKKFSLDISNISSNINKNEFNKFFIAFMIEINAEFKTRMINEYNQNFIYFKVLETLRKYDIKLLFLIDYDLLYRMKINDDCVSSDLEKRCVSQFIIKEVIAMIHENSNKHIEFDQTYDKLISSWYIRSLLKQFANYFKHCFKCEINRMRRHKIYDNFQLIWFSLISFYTLIIDFVLILFFSHININNIMSIIDKFNKRVAIIFNKNRWTAAM